MFTFQFQQNLFVDRYAGATIPLSIADPGARTVMTRYGACVGHRFIRGDEPLEYVRNGQAAGDPD
jgi:hypothetical protein